MWRSNAFGGNLPPGTLTRTRFACTQSPQVGVSEATTLREAGLRPSRVYASRLWRRTVRCQEKRRAGVSPQPHSVGAPKPPVGATSEAPLRCRNCPLETLPRALAHHGAAHRTLTGSHSASTNFSQNPKSKMV
ncbi:hypothetical protein QUB80_26325 [Chlorogloeopsis sp. ULAP01]|uniref:hypothetical protein n=1 Tax=Chlorogloeopsis sp. ULAP01 TaxID=3056483 RepID=UPI0025AADCAB|nr:hypothetical protein [Chlorogloeopsis sp. ULAP01]MDM9384198.1 hypothetical protein [Chlorogloeopsis sp. ULAP01]